MENYDFDCENIIIIIIIIIPPTHT